MKQKPIKSNLLPRAKVRIEVETNEQTIDFEMILSKNTETESEFIERVNEALKVALSKKV